jgi:predicted AlkP superfamily pyrophosphatase or phosphodiesterase
MFAARSLARYDDAPVGHRRPAAAKERRHMRSLFLMALTLGLATSAGAAGSRSTPKLGVLVVFDQMRADAFERYAPLFGSDGFGGLHRRSTAHYDAAYGYAVAETGPGHATLSTGANPPVHGICANRWKADDGSTRYCVGDDQAKIVGNEEADGVSARTLRALTLADAVKLSTDGRGRVMTFSIKDRAAVLTAGQSADLALFYDTTTGRYTTSTAYAAGLPPWLEKLAVELPSQARQTGTWSPLPLPRKSKVVLPEDDLPGESERYGFTRTFPHDLSALADDEDRKKAYRGTPHALDDLISLALAAVEEEKLGQDDDPDLIVLALSPTDFVGHWYGASSLEVIEMLRHADLAVRKLIKGLDQRVGRTGYVLGISADHGIAPKPEISTKLKIDAERIKVIPIEEQLQAAAAEVLGDGGPKPFFHPPHLFMNLDAVPEAKRGPLLDRLEKVLADTKGIAHVYRADKLHHDQDPYAEAFTQSVAEGRCDVMMVRPSPAFMFAYKTGTGADHGTPYGYDTRVPFIVSGPGVRRGRYATLADPRDMAPTLAFLLRIAPPASAQGRPVAAVGADATLPLLSQ